MLPSTTPTPPPTPKEDMYFSFDFIMREKKIQDDSI